MLFRKQVQQSRSDTYGSQKLWYSEIYQSLSCGAESGILARIAHSAIESNVFRNSSEKSEKVLEVGGGDGIHLRFVKSEFNEYVLTDYADDQLRLASMNLDSDPRNIRFQNENAQSLSFSDNLFDRLVATCVLLHLDDPEGAISEWRRVVKNGGHLSIYYPHEPELLTRLARRMLIGRKASKLGFHGFDLLMAREHKNSAWRIEQFLNFVFINDIVKIKRWPFIKGPLFMNSFTVFHVKILKA
jgi:phosphatidylethanolamine/phosphatidyl-N-methylethanolamine N-methyltransferase